VQEPNIIRTRGDLTGKESQGKQNFVILMANPRRSWRRIAQKPKPPFRAALASWVELLKLSGRRFPLIYEDVESMFVLSRKKCNKAKVLGLSGIDSFCYPEHPRFAGDTDLTNPQTSIACK
jgi:hypothetical protein